MATRLDEIAAILATSDSKAAMAGTAGGFMRWFVLRDDFREGTAAVLVGATCAYYLWPVGPAVLHGLFSLHFEDSKEVMHVSGFLIGTVGITLVRKFVAYLNLTK